MTHAHKALKKSSKEKPLLHRTALELKRGTPPSGGRRKQPRWPTLLREDGCSTATRGPVRKHRPHAGNKAGPHHVLAPRESRPGTEPAKGHLKSQGRHEPWRPESPRIPSIPQGAMNSADTSSPRILSSPWDAMNPAPRCKPQITSSLGDAMNRGIPEAPDLLMPLGCHEPQITSSPWETMNPGTPEAPNHLRSQGRHEPRGPQKPQITSSLWDAMNRGTPPAPDRRQPLEAMNPGTSKAPELPVPGTR